MLRSGTTTALRKFPYILVTVVLNKFIFIASSECLTEMFKLDIGFVAEKTTDR